MSLWKALGALATLLIAYAGLKWAVNEAIKQEQRDATERFSGL